MFVNLNVCMKSEMFYRTQEDSMSSKRKEGLNMSRKEKKRDCT